MSDRTPAKKTAAAPGAEGKITQADRKNLQEVVSGDFRVLMHDLQTEAARRQAEKAKAVEMRWEEKQKEADQLVATVNRSAATNLKKASAIEARAAAQVRELRQQVADMRAALVEEAEKRGLILEMPSLPLSETPITATPKGLQEALAAASEEHQAEYREALGALEEAKVAALREVLLLGVAGEARDFIESRPQASEILAFVAERRAGRAIAS